MASLLAYGSIWLLMDLFDWKFDSVYLLAGGLGMLTVLAIAVVSPVPRAHGAAEQIILRKRYWLYYGLTFMGGARRQIFMVFAAFMMVEKFSYSVGQISLLYLVNYVFNLFFAPRIAPGSGGWRASRPYPGIRGAVYRVCELRLRGNCVAGGAVRHRPLFLRAGDRHQDLLPENR